MDNFFVTPVLAVELNSLSFSLILFIIGILAGAAIAWFFLNAKFTRQSASSIQDQEEFKEQFNSLNIEKEKLGERLRLFDGKIEKLEEELISERRKFLEVNSEYSSVKSINNSLTEKLNEQKNEVEKLQEKFTIEFKNIANELLEEKSRKFTEQNQTNLNEILRPLNDRIKDFERKVNDVYISDTKDRASLVQQIKQLYELNQQMTKDAKNLTQALKGEVKTQGNWGEVILESILDKSGLVKGREYFKQESITNEEGKRFQPDILIKLPDNKSLIVDSKVSLTAYERYCSTEDEINRQLALKEHINSIKKHIKDLSSKNYQTLYDTGTLDFVLLFMPIEPAFSLAVQNDNSLFNDAFERNIVIVSPSTLLATLRTIANIWKQEYQNRFALDIAKQSGQLYDKFVGFIEDLSSIGKNIKSATESYDKAMNKLSTGRGNLVNSAEKIKNLGAKATKSLPQNILDLSVDEMDEESKLIL
jgi:DNA recombination protein RmuC